MKLDDIRPGQRVHVANGMSVGLEVWTVVSIEGKRVLVEHANGMRILVYHTRLRLIEEPGK